ncbi:hypothetical protein F0562_022960 [Nyssa sinensis]|uniref:Uncharacterized protein n=1 Tax=Nyssa sinensis TaxID=561372 RepID=A0A5J5BGQ6_9ASTE|nr:hypothetical protein F0562_022960 [Nyssa sinensis]
MALLSLSLSISSSISTTRLLSPSSSRSTLASSSGHVPQMGLRPPSFALVPSLTLRRTAMTRSSRRSHVVCMAPEEEKMTRRSPLDFPIEWERPKPGRRPDIFPQFSPMKTAITTTLAS